MGPYIVEFLIE